MAKLIQVPDVLYDQLKALKVGDESFGSVIRRLLEEKVVANLEERGVGRAVKESVDKTLAKERKKA